MKLTSTLMASFLISTGNVNSQMPSIITDNTSYSYEKSNFTYEKEYSNVYTELESYKTLENNWDGYQGVKPTNELIHTVKDFLNILKSKKIINPNIMVSGLGEISLYWKDNNKYIEIDFDIEKHFSYFYKINKKIYGEDDIKIDYFPEKLLDTLVYFKNSINTDKNKKIIETFESEDKFIINVA